MADCIEHAMSYRKNIVEEKDVAKLFNNTMDELQKKSKQKVGKQGGAVGAIVFAMAGPKIEFALVNDYGLKGWSIKKDTQVLLKFMDPVGVVALGAGFDVDEHVFRTFEGQEWAGKHAAKIIEQARHSLPMYSYSFE